LVEIERSAGYWTSWLARSDHMKEAEWLACSNPKRMLQLIED
jgi:hypothetical protein